MYNRYIPSGNGNYICQRIGELPHPAAQPAPHTSPRENPPERQPEPAHTEPVSKKTGLLSRLLPKGLEADDLLILLILLLLMMDSGDDDDSLTVLLAVAAFFILQ